jgi:hypothetical protein
MFRKALRAGGDAHHVIRMVAIVDMDVEDLGSAKRERTRVVRKYSVLRRIKHLERWPLTCQVGA